MHVDVLEGVVLQRGGMLERGAVLEVEGDPPAVVGQHPEEAPHVGGAHQDVGVHAAAGDGVAGRVEFQQVGVHRGTLDVEKVDVVILGEGLQAGVRELHAHRVGHDLGGHSGSITPAAPGRPVDPNHPHLRWSNPPMVGSAGGRSAVRQGLNGRFEGEAVKVVVTGGAGFIGSNLGRELLSRPEIDEVVAFDDLSTGFRENLDGTGIRLVEATILDADALDAAFAGADAVVHLGALPSVPRSVIDPLASHHANATGTVEVLQAARRAGDLHVVVASSSSVYGANRELPKRESMRTAPISPYAVSKLATEAYTLSFGHTYGLPTLAFRFFNVYGPLQAAGHAYAAVIPIFVDAALRGVPLTVHGDGEQTRDFTYVGTVARVITDAVVRKVTDLEPVNLAFGSRISLNDLIGMLGDILGFAPAVEHVEPRAGDVRDSQADNTRLRGHFPDVEAVELRDGLQATVDWFRSLPAYGG